MLYMPSTRWFRSATHPLAAGAVLLDEGVALVSANGGTVKPSAGVANEKFVGISAFQRGPLVAMPKFTEFTATTEAPVIKLTDGVLGGTLSVRNKNTNAPLDNTTYAYDANTNEITFTGAGLNIPVIIAQEYSPTILQVKALQGDVQPGGTVPQNYSTTGVLIQGTVYTSHFEVADDWTNASLPIRLGANGKFTTQGNGTIIDGWVVNVPGPQLPFLGLEIR